MAAWQQARLLCVSVYLQQHTINHLNTVDAQCILVAQIIFFLALCGLKALWGVTVPILGALSGNWQPLGHWWQKGCQCAEPNEQIISLKPEKVVSKCFSINFQITTIYP